MKNVLARRGTGGELWDPELAFAPEVDVKDEKDQIVVRADIPGVKKEDLAISVREDVLTLKGERKEEQEKKGKDYFYSERFYGAFSRTIGLPAAVKADNVKATYKDGVLEIRLPKDENAKPHEVKVQIQ
jgi:HSP20 family protein